MVDGVRSLLHANLYLKAPADSVDIIVYIHISTQVDEIAVESGLWLKVSSSLHGSFIFRLQ